MQRRWLWLRFSDDPYPKKRHRSANLFRVHRGWFMSEKGRVADAIAVTSDYDNATIRVFLQVGEAKFVDKSSTLATMKRSNRSRTRWTV